MKSQASAYSVRLTGEQSVRSESEVVRLHARAGALARRLGFDSVLKERVRLVAAEIATNQLKYAGGHGCIQVWEVGGDTPALDLFALDWGPGIPDLHAAMQDGFSEAGTLGKGLGTIARLSGAFDLYASVGDGTQGAWHGLAVWARFGIAPTATPWAQTGAFLRAYQDGACNGDAVVLARHEHGARVLHLDALGHGCPAEEVARAAVSAFDPLAPFEDALAPIERALTGGRGAALGLFEADGVRNRVKSIGAGDLRASILQANTRQGVSLAAGVIGQTHGGLRTVEHEWPFGSLLVTASDGLRSSWHTNAPPGLWRRHPQLIAYFMGQVAGRMSDDKSLVVIRNVTGKKGERYGVRES